MLSPPESAAATDASEPVISEDPSPEPGPHVPHDQEVTAEVQPCTRKRKRISSIEVYNIMLDRCKELCKRYVACASPFFLF